MARTGLCSEGKEIEGRDYSIPSRLVHGRTSGQVQNGGIGSPELLVARFILRCEKVCPRLRKMPTNEDISGKTSRNALSKHNSGTELAIHFRRSHHTTPAEHGLRCDYGS